MADHFDFRSKGMTDPEETYYEYKLDGVIITNYDTHGAGAPKTPAPKFQSDDASPDFIDDFLF